MDGRPGVGCRLWSVDSVELWTVEWRAACFVTQTVEGSTRPGWRGHGLEGVSLLPRPRLLVPYPRQCCVRRAYLSTILIALRYGAHEDRTALRSIRVLLGISYPSFLAAQSIALRLAALCISNLRFLIFRRLLCWSRCLLIGPRTDGGQR